MPKKPAPEKPAPEKPAPKKPAPEEDAAYEWLTNPFVVGTPQHASFEAALEKRLQAASVQSKLESEKPAESSPEEWFSNPFPVGTQEHATFEKHLDLGLRREKITPEEANDGFAARVAAAAVEVHKEIEARKAEQKQDLNVRETSIAVPLKQVMDYYAEGFKVNGEAPLAVKWAINPIDNGVLFVLTTRA